MDSHFYVHLSSDACKEYYPSNNSLDFTVKLPTTLRLDSPGWFCGLCEIEFAPMPKTSKTMLVLTDICQESIVDSKTVPLLRAVSISNNKITRKSFSIVYDKVFYMPLKQQRFDRIHVYIKSTDGVPLPSFEDQPLRCTLHFQKSPPL